MAAAVTLLIRPADSPFRGEMKRKPHRHSILDNWLSRHDKQLIFTKKEGSSTQQRAPEYKAHEIENAAVSREAPCQREPMTARASV